MKKKLFIAFAISGLAACFASQHPDGLDKVSHLLGFASQAVERSALMTGYRIPFLGETTVSTMLAGVMGICFIYGFFLDDWISYAKDHTHSWIKIIILTFLFETILVVFSKKYN